MRTLRIPALTLVIALALAACSSSASPTTPPAASNAAPPAQASSGAGGTGAVEIKDIAFNPASITVAAGTKVTWTNNDTTTHTVTLDDNSVDSGDVAAGATFDNTFATAGTFAYHCKIHSSMHGTVVVTP